MRAIPGEGLKRNPRTDAAKAEPRDSRSVQAMRGFASKLCAWPSLSTKGDSGDE